LHRFLVRSAPRNHCIICWPICSAHWWVAAQLDGEQHPLRAAKGVDSTDALLIII
jgi:hypothetical protein